MRGLERRVPPPIVMLLCGALVWGAARCGFATYPPFNVALVAALALLGLALNICPKWAFKRAGTTVNPLRPDASTWLVTSGIYRHTRNPMYFGHGLMLLAWALYLHDALALLAVPAFIVYVTRFQIRPEERALSAKFPDEYVAYCERTPRWL